MNANAPHLGNTPAVFSPPKRSHLANSHEVQGTPSQAEGWQGSDLPATLGHGSRSYLHAVECRATASDNAVAVGTEAALFGEGAVALGQELAAQTEVLLADRGVVASLGVVPQELAAPADVLRAELREVWSAVCVVPAMGGGGGVGVSIAGSPSC